MGSELRFVGSLEFPTAEAATAAAATLWMVQARPQGSMIRLAFRIHAPLNWYAVAAAALRKAAATAVGGEIACYLEGELEQLVRPGE